MTNYKDKEDFVFVTYDEFDRNRGRLMNTYKWIFIDHGDALVAYHPHNFTKKATASRAAYKPDPFWGKAENKYNCDVCKMVLSKKARVTLKLLTQS